MKREAGEGIPQLADALGIQPDLRSQFYPVVLGDRHTWLRWLLGDVHCQRVGDMPTHVRNQCLDDAAGLPTAQLCVRDVVVRMPETIVRNLFNRQPRLKRSVGDALIGVFVEQRLNALDDRLQAYHAFIGSSLVTSNWTSFASTHASSIPMRAGQTSLYS